ncbi:hypothetical protein LUZ60_016754 [Juncus effusus]|nr:hypothetical protein LUZ60_016754 [Juncus effusus]
MAKKISTERWANKMSPKSKAVEVTSVTRDEINSFWRMKKMIEEEHLMAAQKAAARLRAKSLKEEDYRRFEQLLKEILDDQDDLEKEEVQAGIIKDWWTKSKYAYLNQPAVKSMGDITKQHGYTYTYVPQKICFSFYSKPSNQFFITTSFGVY